MASPIKSIGHLSFQHIHGDIDLYPRDPRWWGTKKNDDYLDAACKREKTEEEEEEESMQTQCR
jgi:hypothetical protein